MSDEAPDQEAEEAVPDTRPRRKKKRRRAVEAAPSPPEQGDTSPEPPPELPAFARDFPHDPALDALVAAFEAGDFARVRREAPALAESTDRDDVRAAARELRRRIDPDPLAVYLVVIAAVLLVFLAGYSWLHPHAP